MPANAGIFIDYGPLKTNLAAATSYLGRKNFLLLGADSGVRSWDSEDASVAIIISITSPIEKLL